jgi:protocatechuate 3,4-dioxygenase beta subunit
MIDRAPLARLSVVAIFAVGVSVALVAQTSRDGGVVVPPAGTAAIGGTLVTADATAAPIRRARVNLTNADRTFARTVVTDDTGRFQFVDLAAGRYMLDAAKGAWLAAAYGAKRPGRAGTPIALADGQRLTTLTLRMWRGAVVTGTVRDELGRPAPGITVVALQPTMRGEIETLLTPGASAVATTNELGVYRTYGLPPGEVVVIASSMRAIENTGTDYRPMADGDVDRLLGNPSLSLPRQRPMSVAQVFHPSTTDPASATRVTLAAGDERSGIDIVLRAVPTSMIDGTVTGPTGAPWPGAQVILTSRGPQLSGGTGVNGLFRATTDPAGRYRFNAILPGVYSLECAALATPMPPAAPAAAGVVEHVHPPDNADTLWARAEVNVAGRDLQIPLVLQPAMSVKGRIAIDSATTAPRPAGLSLRLEHVGQGMGTLLNSTIAIAPGTTEFSIMGVTPGRYRLTLSAAATGPWIATSSVARGRDTLDVPLEIGPAEHVTDWVVTISDRPSELTGRITDAAGAPQPDHFIVVFSAERTFWRPPSRRVVQTRPGVDGRFSVRGLPAGDYFLAALTDVDASDLASAVFLEQLVPAAIRIPLGDGERKVQDVRVR